jgi:tyrosine-protein kinase Etk/Wzc
MGAERQLHLRDLVQVLLAHWRVVVLLTAIVSLGTFSQSRRAIPRYQSSATVQVNSKKQVFARLDDIDVEELALRTDPVQSEALVLQTSGLALGVVDELGLRLHLEDPDIRRNDVMTEVQVDSLARPDSFVLRIRGPQGWELRDARGLSLGGGTYEDAAQGPGFGFRVMPYEGEPYDVRFAILPRVTAADMVRAGVGFSIQPNTNVVNVTYTGTDPSLVPDILNEALRALQNYGADRIREVALHRLSYISDRVDEARERYLASLARVQTYKEGQGTTDLSAEEVALINSIQGFQHDRERLLVDLNTMQSILGPSTEVDLEVINRLAAVAGIANNAAMTFQIQNLLELYDERRSLTAGNLGLREGNPQVQAIDQRIAQASQALRQAAQATVEGIQANIASLDRNIANLRQRLATYPGKETQFAQLRLETELQNDTYRYLLSQLEAARISAATISPYIQVIETATVAGRIGIGIRQKLMLGILVGLFLGIVAALFLEYLDQTIKTSTDVERALEVPVLGIIPLDGAASRRRNGRRRGAIPLVSLASPDDPVSEAYRALRTNVTFVNAEQRALQLICVTSPGPGEGKSTTAANLAITLAQQGTRALLVDADLRRPIVHRAFNLVQEPGLTDVLVGRADPREAIRPRVIPNLDVLPAGALPPNPSELLGSEAMQRLLEQLRGQYQVVIFDSPPALAVTDAAVLGAASDAVIVVLRASETEEVAAQRALQQLRRVQARVAGTVLNGVVKERDRYYHYYYYRGERAGGRGALAALRNLIPWSRN